jgi:hypothetical protein
MTWLRKKMVRINAFVAMAAVARLHRARHERN